MAKLTPMMEQYFEVKNEYSDCLLFYRLGDFYELFFEDALTASKELELTLTGRNCGQEERAPMCGVPFHSADNYISRLIEKGYKVAICEQTEDPKLAKGLVKREVIRVVTPGTLTDSAVLDETKNNYIASVFGSRNGYGLSICDVSTGEFLVTEFGSVGAGGRLLDELARFSPAEIICNYTFAESTEAELVSDRLHMRLGVCEDWMYEFFGANKALCTHFKVQTLEGFGIKEERLSVCAAGGLMSYLQETQKNDLSHITRLVGYTTGDFMLLDMQSRRNLELTETLREKARRGSLLWVLDKTKTAMGARLLRKWVEQPLLDKAEIEKRLDSVEEMKEELFFREEIKEILTTIQDFERTMSRVVYQTANGRDLLALKHSIENLPLLKVVLRRAKSSFLKEVAENLDTLENICTLIEQSISEDAPFTVREGGIIKEGFHGGLDVLLHASKEGSTWIHELEERERETTGIKNLKVRYNKVFGYYIEVTKSNISQVPDTYIRKQTLANCERYMTTELNDLAELILGALDKRVDLEYMLFTQIRDAVAEETDRILQTAKLISVLDCLQSLGEVASTGGYVKPKMLDNGIIHIQGGRHPVVEKLSKNAFVPNDTFLDAGDDRLSIITGPNMAGKSTYMRQVALIVLMAQLGSFVPASAAEISVVDRIFTRVGASDDLASGQSTFMVEMIEVANILNNATENSLLILDEIGRGTSTFDGLSIAWAVLEYIADQKLIGAKTLFATHYHELSELEGKLSGVKNYCITVKEQGEDIIFLRKIARGGADRSYGIQVARLAGLPKKVIKRAGEIQKQLNAADVTKKSKKIAKESQAQAEEQATQIGLFGVQEAQILDELNKIDVMALTPIQALQTLFDLQKKAKGL